MHERQPGYPRSVEVERGCATYSQQTPDAVYLTCTAKLHNPSQRKTSALLAVFAANTSAAAWMLGDIKQREPRMRFEKHRAGSSYYADRVAQQLEREYRNSVRGRFTALNSHIFSGLCLTVASMIAGWLQQMNTTDERGDLQRHAESATYLVVVGRHAGEHLGDLGRGTIYGYAFLQATRRQLAQTRQYVDALLRGNEDDEAYIAAQEHRLQIGVRRGTTMGSMSTIELRRLRAYVDRQEVEIEEWEKLREVSRTYLRFSPPGFPHIREIVNEDKRITIYHDALDAYAALTGNEDKLTESEHRRFRQLEKDAAAATQAPRYLHLRWLRGAGIVRGSDMGIGYDTNKHSYVLVAYVLGATSRHRRVMQVRGQIEDINNPGSYLSQGVRRTGAMLFELEYGSQQQALLDQARSHSQDWKGEGRTSGCVRTAKMRTHYDQKRGRWWFEVLITLGFKSLVPQQPRRVIGVHVDPQGKLFVAVAGIDQQISEAFWLTEERIASLLRNSPDQAEIASSQRTAAEQHHRVADALVALCRQHSAAIGIEHTSYRRRLRFSGRQAQQTLDGSRAVANLLEYKLALAGLPAPIDVRGVSPRRDCSACGRRQEVQPITHQFVCSLCGHTDSWPDNTGRKVVRRVLWHIAERAK